MSSRKAAVRIRKRHRQEEDVLDTDHTDWIVKSTGPGLSLTLPFYPDVQFTEEGHEVGCEENGEYWLVEIASAAQGDKILETGLVVRTVTNQEDAYERVGLWGYSICEPREGSSCFRAEPEDVRLI